jgi:hypothetical protein
MANSVSTTPVNKTVARGVIVSVNMAIAEVEPDSEVAHLCMRF